MKFISWNVNGLRACIQKGFLEQFDQFDADFFCLQETKLSGGQLELDLPGYEQYWCYAEKKGYSGTAIFTKHTPQSVHYGLDVPELDNEGRLITLEYPEFYLVTCYTPNAQRDLARIDHRMTWDDAFRAYLQKLDAVKPVIVCGDLNVAHREIDLKNPSSNRGNAGFSDQERDSFQKTLDLGFTDTFRHLHPDKTGAYSWWSYMYHARENNAGWRIDYFLVSDRLKDAIYRADIHSEILGSDHCPVSVDLGLICNGGIWSPLSQGNARQILPEVEEDTAPADSNSKQNASAKSAKALIALAAVFVLLLSALLLWEQEATPIPSTPDPSFAVHVYSKPIYHVYHKASSPQVSSQQYFPNEHQFTDGENVFYSITPVYEASMSNYNTWVRVEALDPLLEAMDSSAALSFELPQGISYKVEQLQYYTDEAYENFGGWLLFFNFDQETECTLTVSAGTFSSSQTVTLTPIDPSTDIIELENVLEITPIYESLNISDGVKSDSSFVYNNTASFYTYVRDLDPGTPLSTYNSQYFIRLSDEAVEALASQPLSLSSTLLIMATADEIILYGDTLDVEILNIHEAYKDAACTQFAGWFVYGNLDTTTDVIFTLRNQVQPNIPVCSQTIHAAPTLSLTEARDLSTVALLRFVSTHRGIQDILGYGNPEQEISPETADELLLAYPALAVLTDRPGAVSTLMNSDLGEISDESIVHLLLDLYLVDDMTPQEQAAFLTGNYPNSPYRNTVGIDDPNISTYDTASLIEKALDADNISSILSRCTSQEAAYQVFLYLQEVNPYLKELSTREDTSEILQSLSTDSAQSERYRPLKMLWDYLVIRTQAIEMTAEDLISAILADEDLCSLIAETTSSPLQYLYTDPYLCTLLEKDGVVPALLDCTPPNIGWAKYVPRTLLEGLFDDQMTPHQTAQVITGLYNSAPEEFSFSLDFYADPAIASTSYLVGYLNDYGEELFDMFDRVPLDSDYYQICFEIYQLLLPHSDILRELQTRPDALAALRLKYRSSYSLTSPVGIILHLCENNALALADVSYWEENTSTLDRIYYSGSYPSMYSKADPTEWSLQNANFAYLVTIPQDVMVNYGEYQLSLNCSIYDPSDPIPETSFLHSRPCYTNADCTDFVGWLVYGNANTEATVNLTLYVNNAQWTDLWVSALTGAELIPVVPE